MFWSVQAGWLSPLNLNENHNFSTDSMMLPVPNLSASAVLMTSAAWLSSCHSNARKGYFGAVVCHQLNPWPRLQCDIRKAQGPLLLPPFCLLIYRNKSHFTPFFLPWIMRQVVWLCSVCKIKACRSQSWIMKPFYGRNARKERNSNIEFAFLSAWIHVWSIHILPVRCLKVEDQGNSLRSRCLACS